MTTQASLVVSGAIFEVIGIALVAAGDLVPSVRRTARFVAGRALRLRMWFVRKVLRRSKSITARVGIGGAIAAGGRVSAVVSTDPTGTLDQKVDFLLREAQRSQERVNALEDGVEDLRKDLASRDAKVRAELATHADEAIQNAMEKYGRERKAGVICLGIALFLWTLSAFGS